MKPGKYDIPDMYQGDTFRRTLRLRSRVLNPDGLTYSAGAYLVLTGYTGKAQIRDTTLATAVAAEFNVVIEDQAVTPGGVTISLTPTMTTALTKPTYVWDLQLTAPNGDVFTYLKGTVAVDSEVTHL